MIGDREEKENPTADPLADSEPKLPELEQYLLRRFLARPEDLPCLRCGTTYRANAHNPQFYTPNLTSIYDSDGHQLCEHCYGHVFLTETRVGRECLNKRLDQEIPRVYRNRKFRDFDVSGPYGQQLAVARDRVIEWTKAVQGHECVSFYLHSSKQGLAMPGNGTGKTTLMFMSFEYLARQLCTEAREVSSQERIIIPCVALDIPALVSDFRSRRAKCDPSETPAYTVVLPSSDVLYYSFDQYIAYLGQTRILFWDDIGQGPSTGMVADTGMRVLEDRASDPQPTFFTSNFSLDELEARIGARAVSRIRRLNCYEHELVAPDYNRDRKPDLRQLAAINRDGR